jgi:hypothetical protein
MCSFDTENRLNRVNRHFHLSSAALPSFSIWMFVDRRKKKLLFNHILFIMRILAILIVALLFLQCCHAQVVDPAALLAAGQCEPFDTSVPLECSSLFSTLSPSIWTAPFFGLSQQVLVSQLFNLVPSLNVSVVTPLFAMPYSCAMHYMRLWCSTSLKTCSDVSAQSGLPFSAAFHSPCKSVCRDANAQCDDFWRQNGVPPIDCDQLEPLSGAEQWPEASNDSSAVFACNPVPIETLGALEYECPSPLIYVGRSVTTQILVYLAAPRASLRPLG